MIRTINNLSLSRLSNNERKILLAIESYSRLYETINNKGELYDKKNISNKVSRYQKALRRIIEDERKVKEIDELIKASYGKIEFYELARKIKEIVKRI